MFTKRLLTCLGIVALTTPALALSFLSFNTPERPDAQSPTRRPPRALVR
jgi:hypothetical protein